MNQAEALEMYQKLFKKVGPGFHPDTPFDQYVKSNTGEKSFTEEECLEMTKALDKLFNFFHGDKIYEIGLSFFDVN